MTTAIWVSFFALFTLVGLLLILVIDLLMRVERLERRTP